MRKKIVIGNLKMYITSRDECDDYLSELRGVGTILSPEDRMSFVICPSTLYLSSFVSTCADLALSYGAQNAHWEMSGKYTGETSPVAIADSGASYVIIGHSERRTEAEYNDVIARKVNAAISADLAPIVCVGFIEDGKEELPSIIEQVASVIRGKNAKDISKVIFAYEPVWAIGSGETPTQTQIKYVTGCVRKTIEKMCEGASCAGILYGGSVTSENARDLCGNVDGFLVGGASRDPRELVRIYKRINS